MVNNSQTNDSEGSEDPEDPEDADEDEYEEQTTEPMDIIKNELPPVNFWVNALPNLKKLMIRKSERDRSVNIKGLELAKSLKHL